MCDLHYSMKTERKREDSVSFERILLFLQGGCSKYLCLMGLNPLGDDVGPSDGGRAVRCWAGKQTGKVPQQKTQLPP